MPDTGTGTHPDTDRCPSCGHLADVDCGCSCCSFALLDYAAGRNNLSTALRASLRAARRVTRD